MLVRVLDGKKDDCSRSRVFGSTLTETKNTCVHAKQNALILVESEYLKQNTRLTFLLSAITMLVAAAVALIKFKMNKLCCSRTSSWGHRLNFFCWVHAQRENFDTQNC